MSRNPGPDSGFLAALRLLVGVVSSVPVCSSPLSSTPVPHHAINSIKHTCSTSCNQLTYKSQFYFPVPAGSLYHSVRVHASQSMSWSFCILSVSEELRANPFFPVLTAEIQPEPQTQISHQNLGTQECWNPDHKPSILPEHSPLSSHLCLYWL